ncbi:hypothetical protein HDU86_000152 [Geranomyces michiganensis]|nr:hypothetical protein HDU86_000152 [Geranomyces michiganensis]
MIVWPLFDLRFACEKCQNGHRNGSCSHTDRKLFEIRAKGRPATQCNHCRSKRKEGIGHSHHKCMCGDGLSSVKKKVEVHFNPNIMLVFTPEKMSVDGLRKELEDSPQTFLTVAKKAKPGKGPDTASQVEITYLKTEVIEETISVDMQRILANPCRCQYGGSCICSDLPPAKPCGSKSKRGSSLTPSGGSLSASPAIAPAMLSNLAGFPRPIDLGLANFNIPPLPTGAQGFLNASPYANSPGHQPILPMPPGVGTLPAPQAGSFQPYTSAQQQQPNSLADTRGHDPAVLQALIALQQSGPQPSTGQLTYAGGSQQNSGGGCGCGSQSTGSGCGCGTGCGCGGASRLVAASSCCSGAQAAIPEPAVVKSCCAPPVAPVVSSCCGSKPAPPPPPPVASCCGGAPTRTSQPSASACSSSGGMVSSGGGCCGSSQAQATAASSCGCTGFAKSAANSCCGGGSSSCACSGNQSSSSDDASSSSRRDSGCGCGGGDARRRASQSSSCCGGDAAGTPVSGGGCQCNAPAIPVPASGGCCAPKPVANASCCGGGNGGSAAKFAPPQGPAPMQLDTATADDTCDCGCHEDKAICGDCEADLCPVQLLGSYSDNNQQATAAMLDELDQLHNAMDEPGAAAAAYQQQQQQESEQSGIVRSASCVAIADPFNMSGLRDALCGCGCVGGREGRSCQCG